MKSLQLRSIKFVWGTFLIILFSATALVAQKDYDEILDETTEVLGDLQKIDENEVPPSILKKAEAVVIVPKLKKGGFVVGGKHGKGVAMVRGEDGRWSDPIFVKITGGSIGFQIGYSSLDLFLVFKDAGTLRQLTKGKGTFTLGGDATVAAGPVGRQASANTDLDFEAEILSYSKSRGVFAGISIEGSDLRMANDLNKDCYGSNDRAEEILKNGESGVKNTREIRNVKKELAKMAGNRSSTIN
ncbi:MAG: lipid-binding SYLF domain-containing protein [Bacteroidota bacterium]